MKRFIYIIVLSVLSGCSLYDVHNTLDDIESYIADDPDSALEVIESIDTSLLKSESSRARHALLHAMALDKTYIDVTDDSLALVAVNYYQNHESEKYLARSLYYLALSYYYSGQYDDCIIQLSKAEPVAEKHDSLYLGFIKVLQADTFNHNYNSLEELACLEEAHVVYSKIGADYYADVTAMRLSEAYINNERYSDADILLKSLLAKDNLNIGIRIKTMLLSAFEKTIGEDKDIEYACYIYDEIVEKYEGKYMDERDYWVYAYVLSSSNRKNESQQIIDCLKSGDALSITSLYWSYRLAKDSKDISNALFYLEEFSRQNDLEVDGILRQSISNIQRDFYQAQYEIADYQAHNRMLTIICVVISSFLAICLVLFVLFRHIRLHKMEKERYIQYAEEISRQLNYYKENLYSSLQKKYISLYKSRYETIGSLFEQYTNSTGRVDAERQIYKKVVSLIDELRDEIDNGEGFEKILNADLDGIMEKLRREVPKLNRKDLILFGYFALGFDPTIISHFMNTSINTIYIRKSRMKKSIEESESEHKSEFLEILS